MASAHLKQPQVLSDSGVQVLNMHSTYGYQWSIVKTWVSRLCMDGTNIKVLPPCHHPNTEDLMLAVLLEDYMFDHV
jgi:hypothetical protein